MSASDPVRVVADALFGLRPATYGRRWDGDEDSPLGRDARAVLEALHVEDWIAAPKLTVRLGMTETALFLAEYRAEQLSAMLRKMARRGRTRADLIADVTQALGYGRAANPEFLVDVARRAGGLYAAERDHGLATVRRAAGFTA